MPSKIIKLINFKVLALVIVFISAIISIPRYLWTPTPGTSDYLYHYTHYNNYLLFKNSFFHLLHHNNLYNIFPGEGDYDLFKYSPTFALFMAPFSIMPDFLGLIVWSSLNALVLFYAFWKFPFKNDKYRLLAIGFILIETVTSIGVYQSNCLVAGFIILAFLSLEKGNIATAALLIMASAFIKLFGLAALILFLFYPNKLKAFYWTIIWSIILLFLPVFITGLHGYIILYRDWADCLAQDYSVSYGFSVMGWLYTWFGINAKGIVLTLGIVLFFVPLARFKAYRSALFRKLFLASLLIWMLIFNYKAESPSFIIAVSGIAIWYFTQEYNLVNICLLIFALIFTVLAATDIFPVSVRVNYLVPYVVKVVPCTVIWIKLVYDLLTKKFTMYSHGDKPAFA